MKWMVAVLFSVFTVSALAAPRCDTCPRDGHGHIKRAASAKNEFKREHPCPPEGQAAIKATSAALAKCSCDKPVKRRA